MIINTIRTFYRHHVHSPQLDQFLYEVLDWLTNRYSGLRGFSFPENYVRRWKLDMLWGLYERETFSFCKTVIRPGMVVVDIGAHIGYFTRVFSKLVGRTGKIFAFEADPVNYSLLKRNTARLSNIKSLELAISERSGALDFYHCLTKAGCHSTLQNIPLDFERKKITVKSESLDEFLTRERVEKVDVIKMDIEGGEYSALKGMEQTLKQKELMLLLEFAPKWIEASGISPYNFLQYVADFGFTIYAITESGLVEMAPKSFNDYGRFIPASSDGSAFGEFVNLYCIKK